MVPGKAGPKHSTSVPFNSRVAMPLNVDRNDVPSTFPNLAVKTLPGPQVDVEYTLL